MRTLSERLWIRGESHISQCQPPAADSALLLVLGCDYGDLRDKKSKPKRGLWNITVMREI